MTGKRGLPGLAGLLALAAASMASETFRLEIGPAVAGGTGTKLKNAVLMVRPRACDDAASALIQGSAEGIVNGVRRTVPLKLVAMPTPGVHAVTKQWPDGHWVLALTATCPARRATAGLIVPLGGKTGFDRGRARFLTEAPGAAAVEASLSALGS